MKITLDTNVLPCEDLIEACQAKGWDVARASTTDREFENTQLIDSLPILSRIGEPCVVNQTLVNASILVTENMRQQIRHILSVISNGSFNGERQALTVGEKKQLNDGLIFIAHIAHGRDVFVTNDQKAFIKDGRRKILEETYSTRIMNEHEFYEWIDNVIV
jgi:hypothetical protein